MLLLPCPWCGHRPEGEFVCLGEAVAPRPRDPAALDDAGWAEYLCFRRNARGPHEERWWHRHGCNEIFVVLRDTVSHETAPAGGTA